MSLSKGARGLLPLAALLAAVGGGVLAARGTEILRTVELRSLDWRFRTLSRPERADKAIVLVMVDQASLDHFEAEGVYWPWPRSVYEAVLKLLAKGGARAVVFDVLFTSPSPYGQAEDAAFGRALKSFGRSVVAFETGARASAHFPVPEIRAGAALLGDAGAEPDSDGVFRRVPLRSGGRDPLPSLPAAAAMAYSGRPLEDFRAPLSDGRMLIRYHGRALGADPRRNAYEAHQAGDVILAWQTIEEGRTPALDPAVFKDKLVFVGLSAKGLLDNRPSPLSPVFAGTEVAAAAADNLLNGDPLREAGPAAAALLVLAALLAAGAASRLSARWWAPPAAALTSSALLAAVACAAFDRGVWVDAAAPQLALWLGFAAASAYGYAVEGRRKRYIQGAFSFYLSPEVVRQIAESPEKLALGGERREVTFYFSDIAGFTSFSERLDPESLARLMNRYLGEMTDTILASGGTLDKYIGDAVMAFWGAPLPCDGHALVACRAALDNQRRLAVLRAALEKEGLPPVRNRIGLNSGPASIGNMGSPRRFSYTAIGDNVNLASRLEGANKAYGTEILISESTREAAGAAIETRELDYVKVKGKSRPIRVYELLGLAGETDERLLRKARLFESGLEPFRSRRFEEAEAVFLSVLEEFGEDRAAESYVERCRGLRAEPPPADWDGSRELTEK